MAFTNQELEWLAKLEEQCIASIQQTDWSDNPLSDLDKQLIGMAVSWTYARFKERINGDGEEGNPDSGG